MDKFPEASPDFNTPEKEENESKDTKTTKTRKIGSFANFSMGKEARPAKEADPEEAKPIKLFERKSKGTDDTTSEADTKAAETVEPPEVTAEKNEIIKQQLDTERAELEETIQTAEAGSVEHIEAITLRTFNERLSQKLEDPTAEADPEIDAELERRRDELELVLPEGPAPEFLPKFTEIDLAEPADEVVPITAPPTSTPSTPAVTPVSAPAGAGSPPPPPIGFNPSILGGGESEPPEPETPVVASANRAATRPETQFRSNSGDLLLGGVLGYMAKRKRDTKRVERATSEASTLAKELESTKQHLARSETALKQAAVEKLYTAGPVPRTEQAVPAPQKRVELSDILRQTTSADLAETPTELKMTPEATAPRVESLAPKQPEKPVDVLPPKDNPVSLERAIKRVREMSTHDLVEAVDKLYIGGTRVRTLYNTNKIDRAGLVKIVEQSLRGGSLQEVYEQVELGQERQRERAREFRHDPTSLDDTSDDTLPTTRPKPMLPVVEPAPELPNLPDKNSLQPMMPGTEHSSANSTQSVSEKSPEEQRKPSLTIAAVLAIALALVVLWLLVKL